MSHQLAESPADSQLSRPRSRLIRERFFFLKRGSRQLLVRAWFVNVDAPLFMVFELDIEREIPRRKSTSPALHSATSFQHSHRIQDSNNGNPHVSEHCFPHCCDTESAEKNKQEFDCHGKPNILPNNLACFRGNIYGCYDF